MSDKKWDWRTDSVLAKGPARVAVIAAHPDDPDHGCAGACAAWSDMGHHVTYVIVTNGSKGSDDVHLSEADLIATREREQRLPPRSSDSRAGSSSWARKTAWSCRISSFDGTSSV
jgi:hypothetical protein